MLRYAATGLSGLTTERDGMTVYAVNAIHTPWVSHGYEPIAMFSTREKAEADAARRTAAIDPSADPEHTGIYEYTVEEWTVDDDAPESA